MIQQFASQFNLQMNLDSLKQAASQKTKGKKKQTLQDRITEALGRMDLLLKENFDLKREIVFERKKYVDLQQAYQDLQKNVQEGERASVDSNQQYLEELK